MYWNILYQLWKADKLKRKFWNILFNELSKLLGLFGCLSTTKSKNKWDTYTIKIAPTDGFREPRSTILSRFPQVILQGLIKTDVTGYQALYFFSVKILFGFGPRSARHSQWCPNRCRNFPILNYTRKSFRLISKVSSYLAWWSSLTHRRLTVGRGAWVLGARSICGMRYDHLYK